MGNEKELINLRIVEKEGEGFGLWLDEKKLHHIKEYEVKKSSALKGKAELSLKMMVNYSPNQESTSWPRPLQLPAE